MGWIRDCGMDLASAPMPDGPWLPEKAKFSKSGRMLLSNVRFWMDEISANCTIEPGAADIVRGGSKTRFLMGLQLSPASAIARSL
jgi:hypothetical protein